MKTYFILSLKHSPLLGLAVWWGPNNCGYYTNLDSAGIYTQAQIDANAAYYNNKVSTLAVEEEVAIKASKPTVDYSKILNQEIKTP